MYAVFARVKAFGWSSVFFSFLNAAIIFLPLSLSLALSLSLSLFLLSLRYQTDHSGIFGFIMRLRNTLEETLLLVLLVLTIDGSERGKSHHIENKKGKNVRPIVLALCFLQDVKAVLYKHILEVK